MATTLAIETFYGKHILTIDTIDHVSLKYGQSAGERGPVITVVYESGSEHRMPFECGTGGTQSAAETFEKINSLLSED